MGKLRQNSPLKPKNDDSNKIFHKIIKNMNKYKLNFF